MSMPFPHAAAGSQRPPAQLLMELLQKLSQAKPPDGAPTYATGEIRTELLRQIVRASFAQDARGRRLRDAWRMVGEGLVLLLREFSDHAPAAEDR